MLILLVLLIFFAALGIPLAFAIGASCVTYILIYAPTFITMLPQRVWNGAYSELMIAMPLFMLAGELMNTGGITQRIINFCMELLRPIRGGLGEVNIVASMIFGGISGSSVADTSALGSILIPAMEKEGYPPEASAGITVASSTMGMIIPPSTPMIVYSMISGASVGALFVAGVAKAGEQQQPVAGRRRGAAGTVSGRCPRRHRGAGRKRRRADRGGGLLLRIHCRIPRQADEEQAGGKGSKEEKESQKRVIVHLKWLRVRCAINSGIIIFVYCKAGMTAVIPALLFHGKGS